MKKFIFTSFLGIVVVVFVLLISNLNYSTKNNARPEILYRKDNSIDLLVYDNTAYVNVSNVDWVTELELNCNKLLGTINRTGISKKFKDFDATVLAIGIKVYSTFERNDIVLVKIDNYFVPYYRYVEG